MANNEGTPQAASVTNAAQADTSAAVTTPNVTVTQTGNTLTANVEPVNPLADTPDPAASASQAQETPPEAEVQNEWQNQQNTEKAIQEDLTQKGLDFDALAKEYTDYGTLSEKSMKALAGAGYPKAVVDAYLEGLEAKTARFVDTVQSYAGGEKGFEQLRAYMQSQPRAMIEGFNAAIESGNLAQIRLTIEGIKSEMARTYGTANPTIMGNAAVGNGAMGYTNPTEMTKDMSDPRYQVDPVFTKQVYQKVKNANFF